MISITTKTYFKGHLRGRVNLCWHPYPENFAGTVDEQSRKRHRQIKWEARDDQWGRGRPIIRPLKPLVLRKADWSRAEKKAAPIRWDPIRNDFIGVLDFSVAKAIASTKEAVNHIGKEAEAVTEKADGYRGQS